MRTGAALALVLIALLASPVGAVTVKIDEFPIPTAASSPRSITVGADGNLWFTELFGNNIGRITRSGVITEFPVRTSFGGPATITSGPDGALWFTENNAGKIGRITTAGEVTEFSLSMLSGPDGITAGPDGALWFTEEGGNKIGRITPTGAVTEFSIPTANSVPRAIAVCADSTIHSGIGIEPSAAFVRCPFTNNSTAITPMVFCASLPPWPRLNAAAETSWPRRNPRLSLSTLRYPWNAQ